MYVDLHLSSQLFPYYLSLQSNIFILSKHLLYKTVPNIDFKKIYIFIYIHNPFSLAILQDFLIYL